MKKYALIILIIIVFMSDAAVVMAQESAPAQRGGAIASVIAMVCLAMAIVFLIELRR